MSGRTGDRQMSQKLTAASLPQPLDATQTENRPTQLPNSKKSITGSVQLDPSDQSTYHSAMQHSIAVCASFHIDGVSALRRSSPATAAAVICSAIANFF